MEALRRSTVSIVAVFVILTLSAIAVAWSRDSEASVHQPSDAGLNEDRFREIVTRTQGKSMADYCGHDAKVNFRTRKDYNSFEVEFAEGADCRITSRRVASAFGALTQRGLRAWILDSGTVAEYFQKCADFLSEKDPESKVSLKFFDAERVFTDFPSKCPGLPPGELDEVAHIAERLDALGGANWQTVELEGSWYEGAEWDAVPILWGAPPFDRMELVCITAGVVNEPLFPIIVDCIGGIK